MAAFIPDSGLRIRRGVPADIDTLLALEQAAFTTDLLSRRSFRRFMASANAALTVCEQGGKIAGYSLVLFRRRSKIARLYSIAVAPAAAKRGIGAMLLAATERAARRHGCKALRLEVHEQNAAAISRYRKSGFRQFGMHVDYYDDRGNALRFEKRLHSSSTGYKDSASPVAAIAR